jgi:hypothetical protein
MVEVTDRIMSVMHPDDDVPARLQDREDRAMAGTFRSKQATRLTNNCWPSRPMTARWRS